MNHGRMKIGELAAATGLTPKTIRFYEGIGLLENPARTESGYRQYGPADVERLGFIKKAKRLGLSLDEVKDILKIHEHDQAPCVHVISMLDQKLAQIEAVIQELDEFRQELERLNAESKGIPEPAAGQPCICGIVDRGINADGQVALAWLEGRRKRR